MPGETLTRAQAKELSAHGVNQAVLVLEGGRTLKVFSNDMVDMSRFVSFDPKEYGINEKVRFSVLRELLDTVPEGGWAEAGRKSDPIGTEIGRSGASVSLAG